MNNILLEKLQKIKALADKGAYGEKEAAKIMLDKLIEKYNIDIADIDETPEFIFFHYNINKPFAKRLLCQIIYCVMGDADIFKSGRKAVRGVTCTKIQAVEIEAMYSFYSDMLDKDIELFYNAFIHKNRLFPQKSPGEDSEEQEEDQTLSEEDLQTISIMKGLKTHSFHKQLS